MRRPIGLIALLLLLAACSSSEATASLDVTLAEWSIDLSSDTYAAGTVVLNVENAGEFGHTLIVESADGSVIAATDVVQAGDSVSLPVDLGSGEFRFTCRIVTSLEDGTVVDHFEEGMIATVDAG